MAESPQIHALNGLDRRQQFRAYMAAFNPTAPARKMIQAGFVLDNLHGSLYQHLAGRADLEPGSQQLLVGGIGSGKTTELLLAENWLREQKSAVTLYIDITAETDLSGFNSGALLAGFGLHLSRAVGTVLPELNPDQKKIIAAANSSIREYAYGKTEQVWVSYEEAEPTDWNDDDFDPEEPGYYETRKTPGKLKPPFPAIRRDLQAIKAPLETLLTLIRQTELEVVSIFDGLDRLLDPEKFWAVAHQDFRLLRNLGVSILATAPLSILYGPGQPVSENFERVHHLSPVLAAEPLLRSLLQKRCSGSSLLGGAEAEKICDYSGGVLRDLITLARDAGEEAYIAGSDHVRDEDVDRTVRQLGTAYLRGLGPEQIKTLWLLSEKRSFNLKTASNIELLITRRVIEYSSTDFRVHPALALVLPKQDA